MKVRRIRGGVGSGRAVEFAVTIDTAGEQPGVPKVAPAVRRGRQREALDRHPGDIVRVSLGGVVLVASGWLARGGRVSAYEKEVFDLFNRLPNLFELPLVVIMQVGSLAAVPTAAAAAFLARRVRLATDLLLGGGLAWLLAKALKVLIARDRPALTLMEVFVRGTEQAGLGFPSGHVAVAAALATTAGPYLPRPVRRGLWVVVAVVAVARMHVGAHLPLDVVGGAALGWVIGAGLHLVRGAPGGRPSISQVLAGLDAAGIAAVQIRPLTADARGSTPFVADLPDGTQAFVKVVGREQRDADLLFKLWRFLAFRTLEDEAPFTTPKRQVEHEAYVSLLAERAGVQVPAVLAAAQIEDSSGLLAQQLVPARGLDDVPAGEVDDDLLRRIWEQVRLLHEHRVAHRDLRLANWMIDREGRPWLIDFGFAEGAASPRRLGIDVAELLTATAALIGPDRAVAAAASVLGPAALVSAAGLLQPLALSTATRQQARAGDGLLARLRTGIGQAAAVDLPALQPITRIWVRPKIALGLLAAAFAIHLLLPQVGELDQTLAAVRSAKVDWLLAAAVGSALTYLMAGVSLMGGTAQPLALGRTVVVQLASSFASRLAPAGLGGVGLNVRYLERSGASRPAAAAAVGASAVAGAVVHVAALVVAAIVLGSQELGPLRVPRGWPLLLGVVAAVVVIGLVVGLPWGRRRVGEPINRAVRDVWPVLRRPGKAAALLGGSAGVTLTYILTLAASLRAFGAETTLAHIAVTYLVGAAAGSIAPVPGGLGVVEATLIAGLTSYGVPSGPAIAGVLTFRLLTFWLPILPGALVFRQLHRAGAF
jgi:glycosyltransferase 2 family protein